MYLFFALILVFIIFCVFNVLLSCVDIECNTLMFYDRMQTMKSDFMVLVSDTVSSCMNVQTTCL